MAIFHQQGYPWWCIGERLKCFIRDIQWAWQRAKRGYCYWDTWGIDTWFFKTIEKILIDFKKGNNGHPYDMTAEEWDDILDKMIALAHKINDYGEYDYEDFQSRMDSDKALDADIAEFFTLFSKYIRNLWW